MGALHSKSVLIHGQIRRGLQSGRYLPGERIDPGTLAKDFRISPTPVRAALYRLVGEGLIADHARNGFHVPLLNEVAMRDLFDWMELLLLKACEMGISSSARRLPAFEMPGQDIDIVKATWQLFDAIARATSHRSLHQSVKRANDRLAPIRRAKPGLLDHRLEELSELIGLWQRRELAALSVSLQAYHARRKKLVPRIVALLQDQRDYLP